MFGIIVNPVSGGGKNLEMAQKATAILEKRGEASRLFATECEGDGGHQVRLALESGCEGIVCIGGDGTLSEVVTAMAGSGKMLYIIPCGTGNDFVRALNLPRDPEKAFSAQLNGVHRKIDCGSVNGKPFINVSGSGFDVDVLRKTEELKAVYPGGKAYRKAVLAVLGSYKAFEAEVSVDGSAFVRKKYTIIEIANGRFFGGGMRIAPGAQYSDGLFDVVSIDVVPSFLIPFLLPLFILGVHVYLPIARVVKAKRITVRCPGMVLNIDGRLEALDEARYEMLQGALDVMLPEQ